MTLDDALEIEAETRTGAIKIHKAEDFEGMRRAGKLAAECLDMLIPHVVPGVSSDYLDTLAREFILDHGAVERLLVHFNGRVKKQIRERLSARHLRSGGGGQLQGE